jgi:hypothetical protein
LVSSKNQNSRKVFSKSGLAENMVKFQKDTLVGLKAINQEASRKIYNLRPSQSGIPHTANEKLLVKEIVVGLGKLSRPYLGYCVTPSNYEVV